MEIFEGKNGCRITFDRLETVVPVEEYVKICVDISKFLGFCKECFNYGNRWSCPPFQTDPMEIWSQFETLRLIAYTLPNASIPCVSVALDHLKQAKERMMAELLELEHTIPGSYVLSAGTCVLCGDNCTRPAGKPCRNPEQMRHSIEALGGDVSKTAEYYLNKPLLWIKDGILPEYLMLVGGLLMKHREE